MGVRRAAGYRTTLAPLLPLHARKKSCHLSHILGLTARRTEKLAKDGDRSLHIHITQKLINRLGAGVGIVIGIHHPSIIEKSRGNIGTGKGREPLLRNKIDKRLILNDDSKSGALFRPCLREFWLLALFPATDLGPVDLSALQRFARLLRWIYRQATELPSQTALTQVLPAQDPYA